jgi:amidase
VYDVIRGNVDGDLFRAGGTDSFVEAVGREPGRLRIGWTTRPASRGVRPDPLHVEAVRDTARLFAELGHDVREVDPRFPDATAAFVPQFFAGIRAEAELVEHPGRLELRTRETCLLGSWVTPRVRDWALRETEKVSARANRVFDTVDVLLTPTIAHRPPLVGRLDGVGTLRSSLRAMPGIAHAALWNVAGNPAAAVPCGVAADGLPLSVQLVGRTDDEATLFSLSAQLEAARPWTLVAGA